MGWTGLNYRGNATHTTLTGKEAFEFIRSEFGDHSFAAYHFHQAKDKYDHNECYAIMRNDSGGKPFICVILIDIVDGELFRKEISEGEGPSYHNCPGKFFEFLKSPNDYATNWRADCYKKNIPFTPIAEYYD